MPGLMFKREILGDGFDTTLPIHFGDFIMLLRYAEVSDVAITPEPVMRLRRHAAQASQIPLSRSIPIRTELLLEYLTGYESRFPEDRAMVARLRRRVMLTHRVALVWGWAAASNDSERSACVEALPETQVDAALATSLRGAAAIGIRPEKAMHRALGLARRVAETLRF
jgi:hypothetical protein